jgi:hypothetical protein
MNNLPKIKDPIIKKQDAISAAGSPSILARILDINRSAVAAWGEYVPVTQAYRIREVFPSLGKDS